MIVARDTFEIVTFTPPAGWTVTHADGGPRYVRNDAGGVGLIQLLPSRPATGDAARVFAGLGHHGLLGRAEVVVAQEVPGHDVPPSPPSV